MKFQKILIIETKFDIVPCLFCRDGSILTYPVFPFQASGLCLLSVGLWMKLQLHKYMEISGMGLNVGEVTIPGVFVALGGSILIFSSLACCCTAEGKAPLLYLVSQFQTILSSILYIFSVLSDPPGQHLPGKQVSLPLYPCLFSSQSGNPYSHPRSGCSLYKPPQCSLNATLLN